MVPEKACCIWSVLAVVCCLASAQRVSITADDLTKEFQFLDVQFTAFRDSTVSFTGFALEPPTPYEGIEIGLVSLSSAVQLWHGCMRSSRKMAWATHELHDVDLSGEPSKSISEVVRKGVSYWELSEEKMLIAETGLYAVFISNCGDLSGLGPSGAVTLNGRIELRSSIGLLPGIHVAKLKVYSDLVLAYLVVVLIWAIIGASNCRQSLTVQISMFAPLLLGLVEGGLWYVYYWRWSEIGRDAPVMFRAANAVSGTKCIVTYALVLACAMGWGFTRPQLKRGDGIKILCCCSVFLALHSGASEMSHLHSSLIWPLLQLILYGCVLSLVCFALRSSIRSMMVRDDKELVDALRPFEELRCLTITTLGVTVLVVLAECALVAGSTGMGLCDPQWTCSWIFSDALPAGAFLWLVMCMMYMWRPRKSNPSQAYAKATAGDQDDVEHGDGPLPLDHLDPFTIGDDDSDSDDSEQFREAISATSSMSFSAKPEPTTIGAETL